ncbi:hypothetical protein V5F41_22345 [Xanthobacter autotrophicus]|uniref:hypothetical protein n=1 Tax=Xanthobacter autotrophicus TaxID=280 RepID=UPI0037262AEA
MSVIYSADTRTARMTAVRDAIDVGSGAGKLKILTSVDAVLVTLPLDVVSGAVSGDVLTFDTTPALTATASGTGTAAKAIITTDADVTIVSGLTVGTSGTNVVLNNVSITSGQTVTITSATLTHNTSG